MRYVSSDYPEIQLARLFWETNADIRYLSSDYPICQSILIDHYRLTQYPIFKSILRDHCLNYVCFNMSDVYHLRIQKATKSNLPSLSYTFEISDTCYPSLAQSISTNVYILQSEYIVLLGSKFHPCLKSILVLTCAAGLPWSGGSRDPKALTNQKYLDTWSALTTEVLLKEFNAHFGFQLWIESNG